MATKLKALEFPSDVNAAGYNRKIVCVLCRQSKKPFQMGIEMGLHRYRVNGEVVEREVEVDNSFHCLNHSEPSFPSEAARLNWVSYRKRMGIAE
jgi:hypothetical protein